MNTTRQIVAMTFAGSLALGCGGGSIEEGGTDASATDTSATQRDASQRDAAREARPEAGDAPVSADGGERDAGTTGPSIGGGPGYEREVCREHATLVCDADCDLGELEATLGEASDGDVVFIDPEARIDMGFDAGLRVPSGVTLAGGRGCGGADGALLYTDAIVEEDYDHEKVLRAERDARVTGLRIRGPRHDSEWIRLEEQSHYLDGAGIKVRGADVEIDNNEIWGFAHAGISAGSRTHVHHNHLHHMPREGLGYGVNGGDEVIIEYNRFDYLRHAVASGGERSYTARFNVMGPDAISHIFDCHRPGCATVEIHHNTVEAVNNRLKEKNVPAVTIRGTPSDVATIHHNWFFNPKEPGSAPTGRWSDEAIVQMHVGTDDWANVEFHDNHYGGGEPSCDIGAPREGC